MAKKKIETSKVNVPYMTVQYRHNEVLPSDRGRLVWAVYTAYPYDPNSAEQREELENAITPLIPPEQAWQHLNPFTEPAVPDIEMARATWSAHQGYLTEYFAHWPETQQLILNKQQCILVDREKIVCVYAGAMGNHGVVLAWNWETLQNSKVVLPNII